MSSTMDAYPRLMAALNEVRGQWRLHKILEGALLTLAGTLGVLSLLVAADNLLHPGPFGRLLLAGVLWGGLIVAIFSLIVKRILEDRRDDFFAALVECKHPELHNTLINALQLGRDHTRGYSRNLIEAIIHDADRMLLDSEVNDAVDRQPTKRAAFCAIAGLLLVAGYAGAMTPRFFNGLARVLLPISDIEPYTTTRIPAKNVEPGNSKVPEGKPVAIVVKVEGVIPGSARVHRRVANGGTWQVNEMTADSATEGVFRFTVPQVGASFDYFITAGDARSATFRIESIKPPQIAKLAIVYSYPEYTGLSPKRSDNSDGEVSGIAGTIVRLELTPTKPLKEAKLVTRGDARRPATEIALDKEGDVYTATFVVWTPAAKSVAAIAGKNLVVAPTSYQIKMEDTEGYPNNDPLWRSIALKTDLAPELALRAPDDKLSVKADTVLPLGVDARDDYGMSLVRILYRVNNLERVNELVRFEYDKGPPKVQTTDRYEWKLSSGGLKVGDRVEYWAEAIDRNVITGPGKSESRHFTLEVVNPLEVVAKLDTRVRDYVKELKEILALQRQNRAETSGGVAFAGLVSREIEIRKRTSGLARAIESDGVPVTTVITALDGLAAGPMAEVVKLLESGGNSQKEELAAKFRNDSLPIQDKIIKELEDLLIRLMRNEDAKKALRRMEKKDPAGHKLTTAVLSDLIKSLDKLLKDQTELAGKFERLPKKDPDKIKEDMLKALNDLDDLKKRSEKWSKGTVQELTKLPKGFTDDFDMRKEVNKIYEEIEKAKEKAKSEKLEVSLEDLGAGLATKMKEDLEMWMPDAADNLKWVLEEPLNKKPMKIPEMPLPKSLQDLIGDLLQKADEFDEDADDITSAWGDNLDQAGWGVSDGPISSFSAKGKTGNDMPNNMEVSGRSADGRRGKSSGQMVGDTAKALPGRKTPARVGNENYEPGKLKSEGQEDPNGATGGGKKAGAGRQGLQGGTPPDVVPDIGRLSAKQVGMREKMEQVAKKLESKGVSTTRLREGIKLLENADKDLTDRRYTDASKKRREAMKKLRGAFSELDRSTATQINRARDLPPQMRNELMQSAEAAYPAGYEALLKSYYKALSTAEK
jgi:drug/metabolite transporter superfamily protein YnfA